MKRDTIKLAGISLGKKTSNEKGQSALDCGMLWEKFQNEKITDKIPHKLSEAVFAVYHDYDGDHTKPFAYFIGQQIPQDIKEPEDLETLTIPTADYRKITAKGEIPVCVAEAWREIWKMDDSDRAYKADFEVYDDRSANWKNAEVDIYIGVK